MKVLRAQILTGLCLVTAVACSTKSSPGGEGKPATARQTPPSTFKLDAGDLADLERVGCTVQGTTLKCDKLNLASTSPAAIEKRRATLGEVRQRLLKKTDPAVVALCAELSGAEAETVALAASKAVEVAQEKAYQQILGYNCTDSEKLIKADANSEFTVKGKGTEPINGKLKYTVSDQTVDWHGAEMSGGGSNRFFVQTDGEFELIRADKQIQSCYHVRASGPAKAFTDRPIDRHSLRCVTSIKSAGADPKSKVPEWELRFEVHGEDKHVVSSLMGQELKQDETTKDMAIFTSKYVSRVISDEGRLTFEIYNRATSKTLLSTTTNNSTLNFKFGFADAGGDGLLIQCDSKI